MATYRVDGETHNGLRVSKDIEAPNEEEAVRHAGFLVANVRLIQTPKVDGRKSHGGDFPGLNAAASILKGFGIFVIVLSLFASALSVLLLAFGSSDLPKEIVVMLLLFCLFGVLGGIFTYATGEAYQALRVIAVNSYK